MKAESLNERYRHFLVGPQIFRRKCFVVKPSTIICFGFDFSGHTVHSQSNTDCAFLDSSPNLTRCRSEIIFYLEYGVPLPHIHSKLGSAVDCASVVTQAFVGNPCIDWKDSIRTHCLQDEGCMKKGCQLKLTRFGHLSHNLSKRSLTLCPVVRQEYPKNCYLI